MPPLARGVTSRPVMMNSPLRMKGQEVVWAGSVTGADYQKIVGVMFGPAAIGPRLGKLSALFQRYQYRSLVFEIQLSLPSTSAASLVLGFQVDPGDPDPPETYEGIRAMCSWPHSVTVVNGWPKATMTVVLRQPAEGYYCSYDAAGDLRFSYPGQLYLYRIAAGATASATIKCSYDIEFYEPDMADMRESQFTNDANVTRPSDSNAWASSVATVLNTLGRVRGVQVVVDAFGTCLKFAPGLYSLTQNYLPTGTPVNRGFDIPDMVAYTGYTPTLAAYYNTLSSTAATVASHVSTLEVPPGSSCQLRGKCQGTDRKSVV